MLVGWTGHRPDVFEDQVGARRSVEGLAAAAAQRWPDVAFVCGGQRGVDQWAAAAGLARRIAVHVVLPTPIPRFTAGWQSQDRGVLARLLQHAASLTVIDETADYGTLAYDRRNEAVATRVDHLIAVWTGVRRGGTFYTLCAAAVRGVSVESFILTSAPRFALSERGL